VTKRVKSRRVIQQKDGELQRKGKYICVGTVLLGLAGVACGGNGGVGPSPVVPTAAATSVVTTVEHELGVCGVTTLDSMQTPTFVPTVIPDTDPMSGVGWHYCMKAFGVSMWAVEKFPESSLRHVAAITAELLDNNEDGVVDDPALNAELVNNYAAMYLVDQVDKFTQFDMSDSSNIHRFKITIAQHSGETDPLGSLCAEHCGQPNDVTLEEVLHLIQTAGYAFAHPDLSMESPSLLTDAMAVAQANGDYDSDGNNCFGTCAGIEYLYWGLTSVLGAQGAPGRCAAISSEWKLCTREKVEAGNPTLYALLTDPLYYLPTRLPDGRYR